MTAIFPWFYEHSTPIKIKTAYFNSFSYLIFATNYNAVALQTRTNLSVLARYKKYL